jgi:hypothetical protein
MNAPQPAKSSNKRLLIIVGGIIIALCLVCGIVGAISNAIKPSVPAVDVNAINTSAVQTAFAPMTLTAASKFSVTNTAAPVSTAIPAPTNTPASSSLAKVGEPVTQEGYQLTVTNVEFSNAYGYASATAGMHFLAVEILIVSDAASNVNVNPFYATVKDSDGYSYTSYLMGKDPALTSQNDLAQGDKMRGWVTFQVPLTAHGFVFNYKPISIFNTVDIRVDLGH